jgi:hypothetical protein
MKQVESLLHLIAFTSIVLRRNRVAASAGITSANIVVIYPIVAARILKDKTIISPIISLIADSVPKLHQQLGGSPLSCCQEKTNDRATDSTN